MVFYLFSKNREKNKKKHKSSKIQSGDQRENYTDRNLNIVSITKIKSVQDITNSKSDLNHQTSLIEKNNNKKRNNTSFSSTNSSNTNTDSKSRKRSVVIKEEVEEMNFARTIILSNPPKAEVNFDLEAEDSTFKYIEHKFSISDIPKDNVAIKTLYISNDPAQRSWIQKNSDPKASYVTPVKQGTPVRCQAIAEIIGVGENVTEYKVGDIVYTTGFWADRIIINKKLIFNRINTANSNVPLYYYLSALGMTALTAYFGLTEVGNIEKGDTVIVTAASGATGSMVVQLAKKVFGASKVIGISGSDSKCRYVESIGADICINYRDSDFNRQLDLAVGSKTREGGADILFDNVGGKLLDRCMRQLRIKGKVVACGAIAGYNDPEKYIVRNWSYIIARRLRVEGFIVIDYSKKFGEALNLLSDSLQNGKIKFSKDTEVIIFDCTGDKFKNIPKIWGKLFNDDKPSGKVLSLVNKFNNSKI